MSRTSFVWKTLLLGTLAQAGIAQAQQTANTPPPKMERIEEGSDTPVTITPKSGNRTNINEKREGGRITEVEVTSGKSTYTMKGSLPGAVTQTGDATGSTLRPPQWKVLEFDLSRKKQKDAQEAEAAATGTAVAPPPPPKPGK
ncbi:hypothetical protein [Massilia sp. TWR1-2-2]|uniref:hypothetical protein n=1 Tax=Massilia sp. TWR1-2-2 TaxID=2804584 RepID=UPI003CFBA5BC